jgi:hypothetical protein
LFESASVIVSKETGQARRFRVEGRKFAVLQNIHKAVFCDPSHIPCLVGIVTLLQHRNKAGNKGEDAESEA